THCNDQFTPQTSPTLGNKRYVNDHSHLRPLPTLETKDMLMTIHTSDRSQPWNKRYVHDHSHLRPLPTLETRYVNDHSHLKPFPPLETK
ncbi:unnamed protein product, partial [Staurois parvus]